MGDPYTIHQDSPPEGRWEVGHAAGAPALEVFLAYDTARALVLKLDGDPAWEGLCRGLRAELRAAGALIPCDPEGGNSHCKRCGGYCDHDFPGSFDDCPGPQAVPEPEPAPPGRCAGCAFWKRATSAADFGAHVPNNLTEWGDCHRVRSDEGFPRAVDTLAYAVDGDTRAAWLTTHETFGCVQFEAVY